MICWEKRKGRFC